MSIWGPGSKLSTSKKKNREKEREQEGGREEGEMEGRKEIENKNRYVFFRG
jgi:hypothetical protein